MGVVSNTSPLSYLTLIGKAEVLHHLYDEVQIPEAVREELAHPDSPLLLRRWIMEPPPWIEVREVDSKHSTGALSELDRGEREAILLAEQAEASLIILDERTARRVAKRRGLTVPGTLGVLDAAAADHLIDLSKTVEQLRQTSFRASERLYQWLLSRHG